jgi:hypothetical protein
VVAIDTSMTAKRCNATASASGAPGILPFAHRNQTVAAAPTARAPAPAPASQTAAIVPTAPVAARPGGVKPMPPGPCIAPKVAYSSEEILAYCRAGWETRRLSDGTIEYNPCFYQ